MTPERERDRLIAAVTSAHRARARDGRIQSHPAWHDLDDDGRRAAHAATVLQRTLEAALDPRGLTTTAKAVLTRIRAEDPAP